jgi:hypothetical protein
MSRHQRAIEKTRAGAQSAVAGAQSAVDRLDDLGLFDIASEIVTGGGVQKYLRAASLPEVYAPLISSALEAASDRKVDRDRARDLVESALKAGGAPAAVVVASRPFRKVAMRSVVVAVAVGGSVAVTKVVLARRRRARAVAAAEAELDAKVASAATGEAQDSTSNQSNVSSSGSAL